ncbi:MAG: hypothetical protein KDA68_19540 [Planctomycetaceae bacterium]|nr:hypothetical protein [Planctomycetaceae bacterium]
MTQNPVKPAGCVLEEIEGVEGRTYRWNPYPGIISRYLLAIFLFLWLVCWGIAFTGTAFSVIHMPNGVDRDFLLRWLAIATFFGVLVGMMLYFLVRPVKYESIVLGGKLFRYDPGSFPFGMLINPVYLLRRRSPIFPLNLLLVPRKPIELSKQDAGSFRLDRVKEWFGERQRLCFDHGADRIEIGENLREPEREWLAAVIQNWQDG